MIARIPQEWRVGAFLRPDPYYNLRTEYARWAQEPPAHGWVYVLLDEGDACFYVGQSKNPQARLNEHAERWPALNVRRAIMLIVDGPLARGADLDDAERRWIARCSVEGHWSSVDGVEFGHGVLENKAEMPRQPVYVPWWDRHGPVRPWVVRYRRGRPEVVPGASDE